MSWYKDAIPKEYRRLEYIQSTGMQYIDTGVPLTSNSRVVMDCELTTVSGTQCFFCSRTEATTTDITSNTLFAIGSTYRKEYYGESKTATNSDGANKRIIIDNDKNRIEIGSAILSFSSVSDTVSPMNCYLMASTVLENGVISTFSNFAYMKLYSCQIYNNDVLIRSFIPCQKKSDSALGLYDTVSQNFYVNGGTGTLSFKELVVEPKMYIGVEKQVPNYTEQEKYLTVDTFSDFFDSTQSTYKWEVKSMGQVLNNVLIEPTGSYGVHNLTVSNNYFEITPKIDFKGLNIFVSYITESGHDKVYFSYNGTTEIDGVNGTSSENVIVNLTDVKAGDKLKFWYIKDGSVSATNEKVQIQLVTIETPKEKVEDGTYHTEELSEEVRKLRFPFSNITKTVSKGYIGANNLSKLCFFTSTQLGSLSIGSTIEVPVVTDWQSRFGQSIVFKIADKNHNGYPDNSTTLITDKIIQIMAFDAKEPNHQYTAISSNGNNNYIDANILQWLNSYAIAGNWYKAKHSADQAPSNTSVVTFNPYDSWAGFLFMLSSTFVSKLLTTTQIVDLETPEYYQKEVTVESKMFLASAVEVGLDGNNIIVEGTRLSLFENNSTRMAYPTAECVNNFGSTRSDLDVDKGFFWMLRTNYSQNSYGSIRCVNTTGSSLASGYCYYSTGVRPLCNLPNNTLLSKEPNANGHYTLL